MIKALGAVLIAVGGAYLGFRAAADLRCRERALQQLEAGLGLLEQELELGGLSLESILRQLSQRTDGPAKVLFSSCVKGMETLDQERFSSLWRRLVGELPQVVPEGRQIVARLGEVLGQSDSGQQQREVAAVRRQLEQLSQQLERERHDRGRVYQAVGLSGGTVLAILLL